MGVDDEDGFPDEVAWAAEHVRITGAPTVRVREWASVLRLPTADGPVWLKVTTPATRPEVGLYRVLVGTVPDAVLHPIAADEDRGLLLLPDGGSTLGAEALVHALPAYARLQRAMAPHRAAVLAAGVPDASPAALPQRCEEAIAAAGFGPDEAARCRQAVAGWARELADAPAADLVTVDHQDLHPHNVLVGPRFYDWGDACVAHPFASLLVALDGLGRSLGVGPDDPAVAAARDAYLDVFADLAPRAELVAAADTARRAAVVARALTWRRALGVVGKDHRFATACRDTLVRVIDR